MTTRTTDHTDGKDHTVCDGMLTALTGAEASERSRSVPLWTLHEGRLERTYLCRSFAESIAFVNRMAQISEQINHHPNFCVTDKRKVSVTIWTHKLDCLTTLDFELAAGLDEGHAQATAEVLP